MLSKTTDPLTRVNVTEVNVTEVKFISYSARATNSGILTAQSPNQEHSSSPGCRLQHAQADHGDELSEHI